MRVLVFDVIETLLDLSALDPAFKEVFGAAEVQTRGVVRLGRRSIDILDHAAQEKLADG